MIAPPNHGTTIMTTQPTLSSKPATSVLVIGGCGFLGHHIVSQLLAPSTSSVSVLDLRTTSNRLEGATYYDADITSPTAVREVLQKAKPQIIIHTASPVANAGYNATQKALYYKVNVEGTRNLLEQAGEVGGVKAFVYTSSASVVHDTVSDLVNADERWPVLRAPLQKEYYAETKAMAEELVLQANRKSGDMLTIALRPAGIFGEGDTQMMPPMLGALERGQTNFQLGENDNLFDFTYVGNVAYAHVLAAVALMETHALTTQPLDHERVDGEAFFITNGSPVYFWDFARMVWSAAGDETTPAQVWVIGTSLGLMLATVIEWLFWLAGGRKPNLTRQQVRFSSMTRYYSIDKARIRLGYKPKWGVEESVQKTVQWFKERNAKNGVKKKEQ